MEFIANGLDGVGAIGARKTSRSPHVAVKRQLAQHRRITENQMFTDRRSAGRYCNEQEDEDQQRAGEFHRAAIIPAWRACLHRSERTPRSPRWLETSGDSSRTR